MRLILLLATALALMACSEQPPGGAAPSADGGTEQADAGDRAATRPAALDTHDDGTGIHWIEGDVDGAFALAQAEGKPVFLYWGAAWCPPCHLIKETVFSKREFVERSRLFVPVYLDGDTERAQRYGEQFGVMGYPTVIVFQPDGTEVIRIASGIDIEAYANVLDVTLATMRPVDDIAQALIAGAAPTPSECTLLAYYSWEQDNEQITAALDRRAMLEAAAEACADAGPDVASRLFVTALREAVATTDADGEPVPLSPAQRAQSIARITAILDDPSLVRANVYDLLFDGAAIARALTPAGSPARDGLVAKFRSAYDRLATDDSAYKNERIYTGLAKIQLLRIDDDAAPVPDALKDEIRTRVAWADRSTENVYERQTVINAAWNTMSEAGLDAEANTMLTAELGRSSEPYYFMLSLAELAERAGRRDEAIAWLARAYEESRGPATRFQWGYNYLVGLLEMAPEDAKTIEQVALRVFGELGPQASDAFYQRTKVRMQRLEQKFLEWNAAGAYAGSLRNIRDGVRTICARIPDGDESRNTCDSFLASI